MADPATTYPIRIDPTIEIKYSNNGAGAIEDITISTNTNFSGTYTSLYVGRRSTEGVARILMRFPALDVSSLAGATVTSATVRVRDLMCEDDPLEVSCHVFTGNVWSGSSATWANSSPNSFESTPLSSNTLSWSVGDTFSSKHWYTFDITSAVQGWINGNYTQSKGIIFKVASSVENGTAIKNRTFGAYDRSSYRPSLTVTYESGTQWIANDTYYLNNQGRGKFIQLNASGTDSVVSGLLSELGNSIKWQIQKVENGYVIRSATDTTKYLSGATQQSDSSVNITTVIDAAIPNICLWTITSASAGGCMIRNLANGRYLASAGTYLYTSTNTDTPGSTMYENFVWRLAPLWYYGNTAEHDRQELSSGFDVKDVIVNIGETVAVDIDEVPSHALWTYASDFTFSHTSGTYGHVSISSPDNTFSGFSTGIATYTATHKVTGRTTTFKVYVDRYTYVLATEFGFDDSDALLIRDVYDKVDAAYPNESALLRAWRASRILGGIIYNDGIEGWFKWSDVAGIAFLGAEDNYFVNTLGFTATEYSNINTAIVHNYNNSPNSDFAHMQISLAARLAYQLNRNGIASNIGTFCSDENVSYLAGWLGDAVLLGNDGKTNIPNGDYHADLDAENIYRLISQGATLVNATNTYYASLTPTRTRATKFLEYIDYTTVKTMIYYELIDKALQRIVDMAIAEGDIALCQYYTNLMNDEQYHIDTIRQNYPDTYDFLYSLRDGKADIEDY